MTNTKKKKNNTKKLLGAIGMLSISAAMLVSSTFAWFAMNKTVTAQTMSITAKSADPYLLMTAKDPTAQGFANSDWATTLTTSGTANWVLPTATEDLKLVTPTNLSTLETDNGAVAWGWASSNDPSDPNASAATTAIVMTDTATATTEANATYRNTFLKGHITGKTVVDKYVLKQTFSFKNVSQSSDGANLKIDNVSFTNTSATNNNFYKAARVLIVNEDNEYALYDADTGLVGTSTMATVASGADAGKAIITDTLATQSTTDITIYFYFDGQDAEAYTDNAFDLDDVSVSFQFSLDNTTGD